MSASKGESFLNKQRLPGIVFGNLCHPSPNPPTVRQIASMTFFNFSNANPLSLSNMKEAMA
jgi:hypothetical protein